MRRHGPVIHCTDLEDFPDAQISHTLIHVIMQYAVSVKHFGTSANMSRQFRTGAEVSWVRSVRSSKCLDRCRSADMSVQLGTGASAEMSWVRSVQCPKCFDT